MSDGRTQFLLGAATLYAAGVSVYIATSRLGLMPPSNADGIELGISGFMFLYILGYAITFVILVALLDLVARRQQQIMLALAIGLAASATYEAVIQVVAAQSYAHYKSQFEAEGTTVPSAAPTNR